MVIEADLNTTDVRGLHFYDHGTGFPVFWLHGTPNTGPPPEPLFAAAERLGLRWLGYDRPGYGGSTPQPGRNVAGAAADLTAVADHLGLEKFAVMGHSGGGPHALAAAALLPGRVSAAVSISGLAPFDAPGLDWFAGMAAAGVAELRAAVQGRAALSELLAAGEFDPEQFTAADWAALSGSWAWMGRIADLGQAGGIGPMVDDDLAYVAPWGFDPAAITAPVLFVHGADDRVVPPAHAAWLADRVAAGELRTVPGAGHVSVLTAAESALEWVAARADG